MRRINLLLAACLLAASSAAQEFNCQVSVIAPQIAQAQTRVFQSMELAIKEFFNTRRFTNQNYAAAERVDINLLLTISNQPAPDRFEGTLQVIYARPVYGTDYNSPILDLVDEQVKFNFLENTQIEFSADRYINNLSSLLGFYAYFVLGLDGDSFSPLGGADYYTLAQQVVNNAQNSGEDGWRAFEGQRNRYWLLDNQLQAVFRPLRELLYDYHRMGMDVMTEDAANSRKKIADSIEKTKLFNTLQIIDPGHIGKYQDMMRG